MSQIYTDIENTLNPFKSMDFSEALQQLRFEHLVRRPVWPKDYYIKYFAIDEGTVQKIYLFEIMGYVLWEPKQQDITATDWLIVR